MAAQEVGTGTEIEVNSVEEEVVECVMDQRPSVGLDARALGIR